jgi:hypothetical protein
MYTLLKRTKDSIYAQLNNLHLIKLCRYFDLNNLRQFIWFLANKCLC